MGPLARILSVVLVVVLALLLLGGILGEVESPEDEADRPVGSSSATPGGTPRAPEQLGNIPTATVTVTMTATVTAEPRPRPTVTVTETVTATTQQEGDGETGEGDGSTVQTGVQFGYACSPVGALGIAEDGRPAKCFKGKDGRARWGYDSNRG